mmetsp:Transcript_25546/g.71864  ORF Transcript_25546/g.71864 Transcript_25546/m.71864 type:complete len:288 (-) Transcript_25546:71-934(-)
MWMGSVKNSRNSRNVNQGFLWLESAQARIRSAEGMKSAAPQSMGSGTFLRVQIWWTFRTSWNRSHATSTSSKSSESSKLSGFFETFRKWFPVKFLEGQSSVHINTLHSLSSRAGIFSSLVKKSRAFGHFVSKTPTTQFAWARHSPVTAMSSTVVGWFQGLSSMAASSSATTPLVWANTSSSVLPSANFPTYMNLETEARRLPSLACRSRSCCKASYTDTPIISSTAFRDSSSCSSSVNSTDGSFSTLSLDLAASFLVLLPSFLLVVSLAAGAMVLAAPDGSRSFCNA